MPAESRRPFYDTNILLYLLSTEVTISRNADRFFLAGGKVSVQVLNEFTNIARKKHRLEVKAIRPLLAAIRNAFAVVPVTAEIHDAGLRLIERHGFSTYDAMIVAAALASDCDVLLSEDMQHGMVVDGRLTIVNPFLGA
jgi:predicted nucleic acid-binding protein